VPDQGLQKLDPGPAGQVVVAGTGLGERGRLAGLPQGAYRQRRADQAERLERGGHLMAGQAVIAVPALPRRDQEAAFLQFREMGTRGLRGDSRLLRQFQTGYIYHYAFTMIIGVFALMTVWHFRT